MRYFLNLLRYSVKYLVDFFHASVFLLFSSVGDMMIMCVWLFLKFMFFLFWRTAGVILIIR